MAIQLQKRRGTVSENNAFTGAAGEITVDTTNNRVRVHDGATLGGFPIGDVINVLDFGAVSELSYTASMTDNLTALTNAIAYCEANSKILDGGFGRYYISDTLTIGARIPKMQNMTLVVDTTFANEVLNLQGTSSSIFENVTIETVEENNPAHVGLAGRTAKEGVYIGLLLDNYGDATFNNMFKNVTITRPGIAIKMVDTVTGGWNTSNEFISCKFTGFDRFLEVDASVSATGENNFTNCFFYNQRSTANSFIYTSGEASPHQLLINCMFWQDGATQCTFFESTVEWIQPILYIQGGYYEIDSYELLHTNILFTEVNLTDKDLGVDGATVIMPPITYAQIDNIIPSTDIVNDWNSGSNYTLETTTFKGNPVYKCTNGTTAYTDCIVFAGQEIRDYNVAAGVWAKTNGTNSYLYIKVIYTDASESVSGTSYMKDDGQFRFIGCKLKQAIDTTKIVDRLLVYVVPGNATDFQVSGVNVNKTGFLAFNSLDSAVNNILNKIDEGGAPSLTIKSESGVSVLTGAAVTRDYYFRIGDLVKVGGRITWTGTTGTSSSPARVEGFPFNIDPNYRGVGVVECTNGFAETFEPANTYAYLRLNGANVPTSSLPTSGYLSFVVTYHIA